MADRTVKAVLKADTSNLVAGMKDAEKATSSFASKSAKSATDNGAAWAKAGAVAGAALAVGVGLAVKAFMDFDKEMSVVKSVSGATAGEMDKLRVAAMKAGADTKYSASEAAKAESELAKLGLSTADILGGALLGSLNLAAAGNIDLAEAATISGQAMKIFSLAGKDVGHIADVLASGANKSAADVSTLGQALQQGGLVAAQTGLTLEDTVGTLAAFSDNALNGSDAGTSLKSMLQRLTPQSAEAAAQMKAVGFSAYDAQGNFKGMSAVAEGLKTSFSGLTPEARASAMGVIFGTDAVRAANVLYKIGATGVDEYTKAVNDNGAAARVAAIQMDNLSGDMEQLKGSIETALIGAGSNANGVLRDMAQFATKAVNGLGAMPVGAQKAALGIGSVTAAGLLVIGAVGTLYPKLQETKKAIEAVGLTSGRTGTALKGLGKAAGITAALFAVGAAISAIADATGPAVPGIEATTAALLKAGGAAGAIDVKNIDALFHDLDSSSSPVNDLATAFARLTDKSWVDTVSDGADALVGASNGGTKAAAVFANIGTALATLVTSGNVDQAGAQFDAMATTLGLTKEQIPQLLALIPAYSESVQGVANAAKLAGDAQTAMVGGIDAATGSVIIAIDPVTGLVQTEKDLKKAADDAKQAHVDLKASIEGFGSVALDARGKAREYQAALDGATASLKSNGKTLDTNTEKGRANQTALEAIRTTALQSITANYENGASIGAVTKQVGAARGEFITMATKMGMSKSAAGALATQLGLTTGNVTRLASEAKKVPKTIPMSVNITGYAATYQYLKNLQSTMRDINNTPVRIATGAGGQGGITHATGGYISGPGTGTSDSIPAMLSNGEFVINAASTKRIGLSALHAANRFAKGGPVGFAAGGFAGADFSGISSMMPSSAPSGEDLASSRLRAAKATTALLAAETALDKLRRTKGHTAAAVSVAESKLINARATADAATRKVHGIQSEQTASAGPLSSRFHTAASKSTVEVMAFLSNIDLLRKRGFGVLADQLLMAGDDQAFTLAAQAVKSAAVAGALTKDVRASAAGRSALIAGQDQVNAGIAAAAAASDRAGTLGRYAAAAAGGVESTAKFYANLQTLAGRGFVALAAHLLEASDGEAEIVAEQAVAASDAVVGGLNTSILTAASQKAVRSATMSASEAVFGVGGSAGGSGGSSSGGSGGDVVVPITLQLDGQTLFTSVRRVAITEASRNGTSGIPA